MRKALIVVVAILTVVAAVGAVVALTRTDDSPEGASSRRPVRSSTTTSTTTTTTTTLPLVQPPPSPSGIVQPIEARIPAPPPEGVGPGAEGLFVFAVQKRLADLRFDPGPIDGAYGLATEYAVQGLQKFKALPVTGVVGAAEVEALNHFLYAEPLEPGGEPNRTEVDIARQTLTLYEAGQPKLLTTASSGSGEEYCYEQPKEHPTERVCEVASTPSGRFEYYLHRPGWDVGVLGGLYNPFYFNGGIAVHGYDAVPVSSVNCVSMPPSSVIDHRL